MARARPRARQERARRRPIRGGRELLPGLEAAVERAQLSEPAARAAKRGLTDVADALSSDAYWRAPAWKRIAVIFAGPGTNLVFAVLMLAIVFMLGVPDERTRTVDQTTIGVTGREHRPLPGDEIVASKAGRPGASKRSPERFEGAAASRSR